MSLSAITLDCPDPLALLAFYEQATGFARRPRSDADFAGLTRADGVLVGFVGFQRVDDHRPPTWPDQNTPQQLHLCFTVDDLEAAETRLLALGAARPAHQPDATRRRVLTDPAGHPFCIVPTP